MGLKKAISRRAQAPSRSCGLVIKVMGGGDGFEKVLCCQHELTEAERCRDGFPWQKERRIATRCHSR